MVYYIGFYIYFVLLLLLLYPFTLFGIIFNYFVFFNNIPFNGRRRILFFIMYKNTLINLFFGLGFLILFF